MAERSSSAIVRPLGQLVRALERYADSAFRPPADTIRGIDQDTWYSPLQPTEPFAPAGTEARGFQYWAGQNLMWTPRPDAEYSASYLKYLATYPLARIAINNVINAVTIASWEIAPKPDPGETRMAAAKRGRGDENVKKLGRFFEMPDREHAWPEWVAPLLDDAMTIDAMSVLIRRTYKGDVAELAVLRGEMITRYIDANGFTPLPPDPAYAQVWWGMPLVNLTMDQLVYKPRKIVPRNTLSSQLYGMSETEQLADEIKVGIARLAFALAYYEDGSVPGALHVVPPGVSPDKIAENMQAMNSELAGNLAARRQYRMIQGFNEKGEDQILFPKEPLLADPFDEMHIKKIMFGYGVSPARLGKTMNRASAQSTEEASDIEGILPIFASLKSVIDFIIQRRMGFPDYEIVFEPMKEPDPLKQANVVKIYVDAGVMTRNEARDKAGLDARPEPEADELTVSTGQGPVPLGLPEEVMRSQANGGNAAASKKPAGDPRTGEGARGGEGGGKGGANAVGKLVKPNGHVSERELRAETARRAIGFFQETQAPVTCEPMPFGRISFDEFEKAAAPDALIHPGRLERASVVARLKLERVLRRSFSVMSAAAVRSLARRLDVAKALFTRAKLALIKQDAVDQTMAELADEWERIASAATPLLQDAAIAGSSLGALQLGIDDADMISHVNQVASEWANYRGAELVGMRRNADGSLSQNPDARWRIDETTRNDLRNVVKDIFEIDTPTLRDVEERVQQAGIFSDTRATMIARTEISRAQTQGNLASWRESKLVKTVRWQLSGDHDHDDECDENAAGSPYKIGEVPELPAHPNCECALVLEELVDQGAGASVASAAVRSEQSRGALMGNIGRAFVRGMSSRTKLNVKIEHGIDMIADAGFDPKFPEAFPLQKLTLKRSASGNLGTYWRSYQRINVDTFKAESYHVGGARGTFVHEYGHHVDFSLNGARSEVRAAGYDSDAVYAGRRELSREYEDARAMARKIIGIDPYENYSQFGRAANGSTKISRLCPRSYALLNDLEWFAESFREYASGGALREKLQKRAPKTYEHIRKIFEGEYRQ